MDKTAPNLGVVIEDDLPAGAMLGALYEVVRKLGEGGMGAVYEVEHVRMQKRFAAKVLKPGLCTPGHIHRLEREAMAASRIEHPNICRVVNLDETSNGRVFLICELLDGQDLASAVGGRPMPIRDALNVAYQVASALEATHAQGIIHRDLKPENVFLVAGPGTPTVKVLDFGVSKVDVGKEKQRITHDGEIVGTPIYMSPENAQGGDDLDARADIYSLGIILYEMLTGTLPFSGTKALDVLVQHIYKAPDPPTSRNPDLPAEVDAVVLKAIEKEPDARYPSMGDFQVALIQLGRRHGFSPAALPEATLDPGAMDTPSSTAAGRRGRGRGGLHPFVTGAAAVVILGAGLFWLATGGVIDPGALRRVRRAAPTPTLRMPPSPPLLDVRIDSEPPGAEVHQGDLFLGRTPLTASLPRGEAPVELRFAKEGHEETVRTVVVGRDLAVTAALLPVAAPPPTPPPTPSRPPPGAARRRPTPAIPDIRTNR